MPNHWFRLYNEIIDDEKIRLLAFEDRWHFVAILSLKSSGFLDKESNTSELFRRKLAVKLGLSVNELDHVHKRLSEVGLIDSNWQPTSWDKRQFLSDQDPTAAERAKRYREKLRHGSVTRDVTDELRVSHTPQIQNTDTDTEKKNKKRAGARIAEKPDDVSQQVWDDFKTLRAKKDAPLTVTALSGIRREADKAGIPLENVMKTCCERGWQGFDADWVSRNKTRGGTPTKYTAITLQNAKNLEPFVNGSV